MKNILLISLIIGSSLVSQLCFAQPVVVTQKPSFPEINWVSKGLADTVTIQNGSSARLTININVSTATNAAGINIKNCGTINHVDAGSSAICITNDANNPVNFTSDSQTKIAAGTYQIEVAPTP